MRKVLILSALLGAISVILGAFGAHYFEKTLTPADLASYQTGIRYMMLHSIVLFIINALNIIDLKALKKTNILFLLGILFFSGSIIAMAMQVPASAIWFITPLGGLLLIFAWLYLAIGIWRKKDNIQ